MENVKVAWHESSDIQKVGENSKHSLEQVNYGMLIQGMVFNLQDSVTVMKRSTQCDVNMKHFITS